MKSLYTLANWAFGLIFTATGLLVLIDAPFAALFIFIIAGLFLPPVRTFCYSKTKVEIAPKYRGYTALALMFAFSAAFNAQLKADKEKQQQEFAKFEREAKQAETDANNAYFRNNREQVLALVNEAMHLKQYDIALFRADPYLTANDTELNEIVSKARNVLAARKQAKERKEKEAALLAELATKPGTNRTKDIYSELLALAPENTTYKSKLQQYTEIAANEAALNEKIAQEQRQQLEAHRKKFGNEPIRSSWDNSYHAVERYLERNAHDPDSIDISGCTKATIAPTGWLVACEYRAKNGFGALIKTSSWFIIVNDTVIDMER